jgi:hypothetical protein
MDGDTPFLPCRITTRADRARESEAKPPCYPLRLRRKMNPYRDHEADNEDAFGPDEAGLSAVLPDLTTPQQIPAHSDRSGDQLRDR